MAACSGGVPCTSAAHACLQRGYLPLRESIHPEFVGDVRQSDRMSDSPATSVLADAPSVTAAHSEDTPTGAGAHAPNDRPKRTPLGAESLLCSTCHGVIIEVNAGSYTVLRGQLILSNGYCPGNCPSPERP